MSECAVDKLGQRRGRSVHRRLDGPGVVSHRERFPAFEARFHRASFVIRAALGAVLVPEMNFHARNVIAEMFQRGSHDGADVSAQCFVVANGVVGIGQNLHGVPLLR